MIIGAGAAGGAAAEMLRREGYDGPVSSAQMNLCRPIGQSFEGLSRRQRARRMDPVATPEFYREQKIDALTNTTVTSIDPKAKQVMLSDGSLGYGALLLATSQPVRLTI